MLVAALLLVGCSTPVKRQSPPMPPQRVVQAVSETEQAEAFVGPVAPKRLQLQWDMGETDPNTVTEVWTVNQYTGELTFFAETTGTTLELWADQPEQFFICRHRLYGIHSEWNIKLE
jgi:hypothetical protein